MIWNILFIHAASTFRKFFFITSVILTNSAPILWSWLILSRENLESPTVLKYRSYIYMYIYMAVLGLCCCAWGFSASRGYSSCAVRASHCGGFSCGTRTLGEWAQQLWHTGLVAWQHVGSSRAEVEPVSPVLAGGFPTPEPPGNSWIVLLFRYGKVNRPGDDCHGRDHLLCSFFPRGRGTSLQGDTQGSTRASQEAKGLRGEHRQKPLLWISCKRMCRAG